MQDLNENTKHGYYMTHDGMSTVNGWIWIWVSSFLKHAAQVSFVSQVTWSYGSSKSPNPICLTSTMFSSSMRLKTVLQVMITVTSSSKTEDLSGLLSFLTVLSSPLLTFHPAIMDVLLSQRCAKILVGDPHQQIYTFRGAVNALNIVDHTHVYYLTQVHAERDSLCTEAADV